MPQPRWIIHTLVWTALGMPGALTGCGGTSTPTDDPGPAMNDNMAPDQVEPDGDEAPFFEGRPLSQFRTALFQGSGNCAVCHSGLTTPGGTDVSIGTAWRATMMANAARDPFFLASLETEVAEAPAGLRAIIEDTCAACHMPLARTQALADGTSTAVLDDGFLSSENPLHDAAMEGVSCTLCHQIQPTDLGTMASFSGGYNIDELTAAPDRLLFGPYMEPLTSLMRTSVGFTPTFGEHLTTSAVCATCHTLFTPTLDASGEIVGTFPEQVPYLEWQHSAYGDGSRGLTECQDCHMPVTDEPVVISTLPAGLAPRSPFHQHTFRGGNVFMLKLLRSQVEALGLRASTADFDAAIADTVDYLAEDTADVLIAEALVDGSSLRAEVHVTVHTGHKFPTSFPSRRAWIHFTATDGNGQPFFESGAPLADGRIAGNDGDASTAAYEPHRRTVRSPEEVQIYEAIMGDTDDRVTVTLLRAARYLKDNRLLPDGFDKATAAADIAVIGAAAADADFTAGGDIVQYEVDLDGHTGPYVVTARLVYQSVAYGFARGLRAHDGDSSVMFTRQFESADHTPALIAEDRRTVR